MGSLFTPEPEQWGLRGDAYLWGALREDLEQAPIPVTDDDLATLLVDRIRVMTDVDLRLEQRDVVFRDELAHGGMSSGRIHLPTWRDRLVPLLIARAAGARA